MKSPRNNMNKFPHITDYVNELFAAEKQRFDYKYIRPILLVLYFVLRLVTFPIKSVIHRVPYGFENYLIDGVLAFGIKYLAHRDAVELLIRHVQIEPLLYRHLLIGHPEDEVKPTKPILNGIDGNYNVDSLKDMVWNNMTVAHDELSYELEDRFNKETFLENIDTIRRTKPKDHNDYSKRIIETCEKSSFQLIGCTNVVLFIVFSITLFADLKTTVKALNSFGSDTIALWAFKHLYEGNHEVETDLDFYMQVYNNRGHYNSSVFFSDPSQYLYYHIVFDEYAYDALMTNPPKEPTV